MINTCGASNEDDEKTNVSAATSRLFCLNRDTDRVEISTAVDSMVQLWVTPHHVFVPLRESAYILTLKHNGMWVVRAQLVS